MRRAVFILVLLSAATLSVVVAGVELLLHDGQVVTGAEVRRDGEAYLLSLEDGGTLVFPGPLVREVRLLQDEEQPPPRTAPTGLRDEGAQQLAGAPAEAPRTSRQIAALGRPSRFAPSVVDPTWRPKSDWDMNPENNNFAPSTWSESVIDNEWKPMSAFDARKDVLSGSRSSFRSGVVDNSWQPEDGFKK